MSKLSEPLYFNCKGQMLLSIVFPLYSSENGERSVLQSIDLDAIRDSVKRKLTNVHVERDSVTERSMYRIYYIEKTDALDISPFKEITIKHNRIRSLDKLHVSLQYRLYKFGLCSARLIVHFNSEYVSTEDLIDFSRELYAEDPNCTFVSDGKVTQDIAASVFVLKTFRDLLESIGSGFDVDEKRFQTEPIFFIEDVLESQDSLLQVFYERYKKALYVLALRTRQDLRKTLDLDKPYFRESVQEYGYERNDLVLLSWPGIVLMGDGRVKSNLEEYVRTIETARLYWIKLKVIDEEQLDKEIERARNIIEKFSNPKRFFPSVRPLEDLSSELERLRFEVLRFIDYWNANKIFLSSYYIELNERLLKVYYVPELHRIVMSKLDQLERLADVIRDRISKRNDWLIQILLGVIAVAEFVILVLASVR